MVSSCFVSLVGWARQESLCVVARVGAGRLHHLCSRRTEGGLAQAVPQGLLQLSNLRHHGQRVLSVLRHLGPQALVLFAQALNLVAKFRDLVGVTVRAATRPAFALYPGLLALVVVGRLCGLGGGGLAVRICVDSSEVLVEILLAGEALAGVTLAVGVGAVDRILRSSVLPVDFALVAEETAGVRKSGEILTARHQAAVRALMLVHVFAMSYVSDSARNGVCITQDLLTSTRICARKLVLPPCNPPVGNGTSHQPA